MSEEKKKTTAVVHAPPAGFEKVIVDMPSFKPEPFSDRETAGSKTMVYNGKPLTGEILGARNFGAMKDADGSPMTNEDGETRDQVALLVKVSAEVDVIGRDQIATVAKPGDVILWFATTKVRQAIMQALRLDAQSIEEAQQKFVRAMNGPVGLKFWCLPLKQIPHPKKAAQGFKLWDYDFRLHPDPVKRVGTQGLAQHFLFAQDLPGAALPAGGDVGTVLPATNGRA